MRSLLFAVGYIGDGVILACYADLQTHGTRKVSERRLRHYNWANALSAPVLLGVEALTGAWPVMVLTLAYGTIAVVGLRRA